MKMFACILLLACVGDAVRARSVHAQTSAEALDLVLPQGKQRVSIEIIVARQSPAASWHAFLDRWFDFFDTDGDGALSKVEADRIFPLPLLERKSVRFDFTRADADNDTKVTRSELKAFYRSAGFTPYLCARIVGVHGRKSGRWSFCKKFFEGEQTTKIGYSEARGRERR